MDEMYAQLAEPYINAAKQAIYITADKTTVQNIARCYALSDRSSNQGIFHRTKKLADNHGANRTATEGPL
jgi:hypothetical protein